MTPDQVLPVELAGFAVTARRDGAQLEWQTASETGNAGFAVQHQPLAPGDTALSADRWTRLGFVDGAGTTTKAQQYQYRTEELDVGRHAFRLVQVDEDGTPHATDARRVEVALEEPFAVSPPRPNPSERAATLEITVQTAQEVTVAVYDVLGRRVAVALQERLPGQETKQIQLPAHRWASGTYFVRIRGEDFATTRRMTVVH